MRTISGTLAAIIGGIIVILVLILAAQHSDTWRIPTDDKVTHEQLNETNGKLDTIDSDIKGLPGQVAQAIATSMPAQSAAPTPAASNGSGNSTTSPVPTTSTDAAALFGGDASSWSPMGANGWVYKGPTANLSVSSGWRLDTPYATCDGSGSTGLYGPASARVNQATAWYVPGETNCGR